MGLVADAHQFVMRAGRYDVYLVTPCHNCTGILECLRAIDETGPHFIVRNNGGVAHFQTSNGSPVHRVRPIDGTDPAVVGIAAMAVLMLRDTSKYADDLADGYLGTLEDLV